MSFQMGSSDMPWSRFMHLLVCMYIASLIFHSTYIHLRRYSTKSNIQKMF